MLCIVVLSLCVFFLFFFQKEQQPATRRQLDLFAGLVIKKTIQIKGKEKKDAGERIKSLSLTFLSRS